MTPLGTKKSSRTSRTWEEDKEEIQEGTATLAAAKKMCINTNL